jgi:hypothetical protein
MTEFLLDGRQTGKTSAVLGWARGDVRRQIVTHDEREAARLRDKLLRPAVGAAVYDPNKVVTIASLLSGGYGRSLHSGVTYNELAVDNLDLMLAVIFKRPVGLVTATQGIPNNLRNFYAEGGNL